MKKKVCGLFFYLVLSIHPLSGTQKEEKAGCRFRFCFCTLGYLGDGHLHGLGDDDHARGLAPIQAGGQLALVHRRRGHTVGRLVQAVGDDLDEPLVASPGEREARNPGIPVTSLNSEHMRRQLGQERSKLYPRLYVRIHTHGQ